MLLVIFGAGASYGSADGPEELRPPLADQLLDYPEVARKYRGSSVVVDYVRRRMAERSLLLEDALAEFGARAKQATTSQQHLVAFRFYLCDVIASAADQWLDTTSGQTRYLSLLNYLAEWQEESNEPIALVTFNYDTLLDDALSEQFPEWVRGDFKSYIEHRQWSLLKLHGSVTWSRLAESERWQDETNYQRAIHEANGFARSDLRFELHSALAGGWDAESVAAPALAVPMTGKTDFECPPDHVETLIRSIPEVKRVLICGWRASEEHMLEVLSGLYPGYFLGVVAQGQNDVEEVHERLDADGRKGVSKLDQPGGMEALVGNLGQDLQHLLGPWR